MRRQEGKSCDRIWPNLNEYEGACLNLRLLFLRHTDAEAPVQYIYLLSIWGEQQQSVRVAFVARTARDEPGWTMDIR